MRSCCSNLWKLSYHPLVTCLSNTLSCGLMVMATSPISSSADVYTFTFCSSTMEFMAATCLSLDDELWNSSSSLTLLATFSSMTSNNYSVYSFSSRLLASILHVSCDGVPFIFIMASSEFDYITPILSMMMLLLTGLPPVFLVRPELDVVVFKSRVLRRSELWLYMESIFWS